MLVVEVGLKLNNTLEFYNEILKKNNAINRFNCITQDIYWTNKNLDNMTENEMKRSCIRLRITEAFGGTEFKGIKKKIYRFETQEDLIDIKISSKPISLRKVNKYISMIESKGYKKIFDTTKIDYQYSIGNMKSRIQLQDISDIGLLLYYDNPDYYELPLEEQRNKLIDELNSYGFDFKYTALGLDKLRTLYYKEEKYSKNQNG